VPNAHVLEHADACDLVVVNVLRQVKIVAKLDAHAVLQSPRGDLRRHKVVLIARKRDAGRLGTVVLRRPENESAPPATDVEQPLAGSEAQLAANMVKLVLLGVVER